MPLNRVMIPSVHAWLLSCFSHVWLLRPHGLCPWDSPGKNTRVGCHFLLQGIFQTQGSNLSLLCWQAESLQLSHQEKYRLLTIYVILFNYCKTSLKERLLYLFYRLSNLGLESIKVKYFSGESININYTASQPVRVIMSFCTSSIPLIYFHPPHQPWALPKHPTSLFQLLYWSYHTIFQLPLW